jgi:hypothetical protein
MGGPAVLRTLTAFFGAIDSQPWWPEGDAVFFNQQAP